MLRLGTDIHTEYRYDTDRNLTGLRTWLGEGGNGWKRKEEEPGKGDAGTGGKTGCEVPGETGFWFGTGILADNTYTYDRNGTMRTKQTLEGLTEYCYNEVSALVKVQYPERTDELFYDKAGNRSRKISDGVETRYTYPNLYLTVKMSWQRRRTGMSYGISEGTGFWRRTVNMRGRITIMWGMNWGALYM